MKRTTAALTMCQVFSVCHFINGPQQCCEAGNIIPILQRGKQSFQKDKYLTSCPTAFKCQSWKANPGGRTIGFQQLNSLLYCFQTLKQTNKTRTLVCWVLTLLACLYVSLHVFLGLMPLGGNAEPWWSDNILSDTKEWMFSRQSRAESLAGIGWVFWWIHRLSERVSWRRLC